MPRPTWGETAEALIDLAGDVALTKKREREIDSIVARCNAALYGDDLPTANADVDSPLCERTLARVVAALRRKSHFAFLSTVGSAFGSFADELERGEVEL